VADNNELGAFSFDTTPFENGMEKMAESMDILPQRAKKITEAATRQFKNMLNSTNKGFAGLKKIINSIIQKPLTVIKKFGAGTKKIFGGVGKIFGGMKERLSGVKNASQDMSKSFLKSMTKMALRIGAFKLALRGIRSIMSQMPEIGQTLGLAKDVFFKNFLFPLRKSVFPYLQRLLDWTRDNRTRFVKWGAVLANIFRTIAFAVKNIIDIGKTLTKSFMGFVERIFGTPVKNLQNLLNLLSFKFAVVLTMLQSLAEPLAKLLEPLIETIAVGLAGAFQTATTFASAFFSSIAGSEISLKNIFNYIKLIVSSLFEANQQGNSLQTVFKSIGELAGNIFKFVINITESFLKGLTPAVKNIMTPLKEIYNSLNNIFKKIFSSEKSLKTWQTIFEFLGKTIGTGLVIYFNAIAKAIELINLGVEKLFNFFESDKIKKAMENFSKIAGFFKGALTDIGENVFGISNEKSKRIKVHDAIIRPDGKIIQTDQKDTIIATKNNPELMLNKNSDNKAINNIKNENSDNKAINNIKNENYPVFSLNDKLGEKNTTTNQSNKKISVNIDFKNMQIILKNGSQDEAQTFGFNIVEIIRQKLAQELEILGV